MFSARLYIRILLQVVAIVLVAGLGVAGIVTGRAVILGFVALFIAAWLISLLVYYLNASNRRIQLFLDAIEDDESMLYFPEDIGSREQRRLHAAFNRIHMLMTENRRKAFDRELHCKEYESWDKLMHVLTHEIMNSIAPISSLSETFMKRDDVIHSSLYEGIRAIRDTSAGLISFVDSYRKFSSLQKPSPEPFYVTELAAQIEELHIIPGHITFTKLIEPSELMLYADPNLIRQVLLNLIKNAVQAIGDRKGRIHLRAYSSTADEHVFIYVSNNGPVIPENEAEEIFVPFFTTKKEGSGIGLSLSRQIMKLSGGTITLLKSGTNGWNTTFVLEFE